MKFKVQWYQGILKLNAYMQNNAAYFIFCMDTLSETCIIMHISNKKSEGVVHGG
jgi:hypothetical protein